jgi:peptidyl-tRNA hydrolase
LQVAQAVHAAISFATRSPELAARWHHESNFLVVVAVPDEGALMDLITAARAAGVSDYGVREPDLDDTITAVALEPGRGARRLCSQLPLALREMAMT